MIDRLYELCIREAILDALRSHEQLMARDPVWFVGRESKLIH